MAELVHYGANVNAQSHVSRHTRMDEELNIPMVLLFVTIHYVYMP